jgi:Transposase C of IS166 homeodomain
MDDAPATLPDLDKLDPASLKALVVGLHAYIGHLKLVIAKLRRTQFGRKSEKLTRQIEQLELQLEAWKLSELRRCSAQRKSLQRRLLVLTQPSGVRCLHTCAVKCTSILPRKRTARSAEAS